MFEVHERKRLIINSTIIFSLVFSTTSFGIWKIQDCTFFFDGNKNETVKKESEITFIDSNLILGAAGMLSIMMTLLFLTIKYISKAVTYHDFDENDQELINI